MHATATEYLGQVLLPPSPLAWQGPIQLFVASTNALKVEAARSAFLKYVPDAVSRVTVQGFNAASLVMEQPVNNATVVGASNRLRHLQQLSQESHRDDALQVLVSMENGIFSEEVENLKNKAIFYDEKRKAAWVDRCYVIVQVFSRTVPMSIGKAYSRGVPVPVSCVRESEKSGWNTTCGTFIEKEYGFNNKDWHGHMAGVSRQMLMEEAILSAFIKSK